MQDACLMRLASLEAEGHFLSLALRLHHVDQNLGLRHLATACTSVGRAIQDRSPI